MQFGGKTLTDKMLQEKSVSYFNHQGTSHKALFAFSEKENKTDYKNKTDYVPTMNPEAFIFGNAVRAPQQLQSDTSWLSNFIL